MGTTNLTSTSPPSIMGKGGGDVQVKFVVPIGKDRGLTRETVKDILCEAGGYNDLKCDPPWDLTDDNTNGLFKKVDNGFDYCTGSKPGSATAQADFADDPVSDADLAVHVVEDDGLSTKARQRKARREHERRKRGERWSDVS
jgi:hypothetical protein